MFVLFDELSHTRDFFFWRRFRLIHSRIPERVKDLINSRTSQCQAPQGLRFAEYSLSPAAANGLRSSPAQKDD